MLKQIFNLDNFNIDDLYPIIIAYSTKFIISILILIIGLFIIKRFIKFVSKKFEKHELDKSLRSFLITILKVTLQILLIISVASMLGAQMTSFIAILGSAGLAVGLALQGSLSNFAGGVLILILKPFRAGDYIEAAGYSGTVEEIQIFYTILNTPDNKKVIVPNSNLSNSGTINYSRNPTRRVDFVFSVGYDVEIRKVKEVLTNIVMDHPLIFKDPKPKILLGEHGANSINFYLRVWSKNEDYWTIYYEIMETVKIRFDEEGISIPYPQLDLHIHK